MEHLRELIASLLHKIDARVALSAWTESALILLIVLTVVVLFELLSRLIVRQILPRIAGRIRFLRGTRLSTDHQLVLKVVRFCAVSIFKGLFPLVLPPQVAPWLHTLVTALCSIYQTILVAGVIGLALDICRSHLLSREATRNHPLVNITQAIKVVVYCVGAIVVISILFSVEVSKILTSLAAASAVLMLIFKDTILGFVAGIQLSSNDMVRVGDWITMDKYGADGDVIDITLNTVKVRNFDNTITTIPPYAMVSDSFQNWRAMQTSGGRRVKRSVVLDVSTIKPLSADWKPNATLPEIVPEVLAEALKERNIDADFGPAVCPPQTYIPTNAGVYRRYIYAYLKQCTAVHETFVCIVRQQPMTEKGMPIELYFFTRTTEWLKYESIQSNLMEYFVSIAPAFGLKIHQRV